MNLQKLQNRKIKEKIQAKLLFETVKKAQTQCKRTMADLERNHKKSSEEVQNHSLPTTL